MRATVLKPFHIVTGSHTRNLSGTGIRTLNTGESILLSEPAGWTSNVWITCEDGCRGKIECGHIRNLINDGRIKEEP